jgi:hypothetical protein
VSTDRVEFSTPQEQALARLEHLEALANTVEAFIAIALPFDKWSDAEQEGVRLLHVALDRVRS